MKITTKNFEVLNSGSVITYENEPITFHLADDLRVTFVFRDDKNNKEHRMDFNPIDNNELELILINFNNSLGTGNIKPISIGTLNNRRLFTNFRVYALSEKNKGRTIHYTWYLGEEVKNG